MPVTILGGGVSGITTGLLLAALGYRPTLVTACRTDRALGTHVPRIASLYPAASVIPHAIGLDDVNAHMRDTQTFFEALRQSGTCGVRLQHHYEVFETPVDPPDYAPSLHDFQMLPEDGTDRPEVPRLPGTECVFGWTFRTYFAETPTYLRRLYFLFEAAGGTVVERRLRREDLAGLPGDALVNCLGAGSRDVFDDDAPARFLRGILVHADVPGPILQTSRREAVSYNYEPRASVYADAAGRPAGLYAYPRTDAWLLGGTKEPGTLSDDGHWVGPPVPGPTVSVEGVDGLPVDVPRPVIERNAQLLQSLTGVDVRAADLRATVGIRYARDLDGEGVRLEATTFDGRPLVHNVGHGGAGVTVSWSCALRVARHLEEAGVSPSNQHEAPAAERSVLRAIRNSAQSHP